ncbi:ABC transporter ATP-binding protein [Paenibacillus septentrionalis]|uniref:ABC transporter ATP-binding protein n=1 Tax=Paenibacillus septentrionalis TaxID=429342 RepID=A0ABW1V505_9BACL
MSAVLTVDHVVKAYGAERKAVDGIQFQVKEGICFGLLGPNGAGKSTLMKMMAGIIQADQGSITLLNQKLGTDRAIIGKHVGYVPQEITLYGELSGRQNLYFFGKMYGLRGSKLKERTSIVLDQVGLSDRADEAVSKYSGGMKRRINIAAALLHEPKLVVLDEPTVGIDPQSRNHIFELIHDMKRDGKTIIYSTHYLEEAEALCDELAIIDHGKIIAAGELSQLLESHAMPAVYVEAEGWSAAADQLTSAHRIQPQGKGWLIEGANALQLIHDVSSSLIQQGHRVRALQLQQPTLDSVFMKLTGTALRDG